MASNTSSADWTGIGCASEAEITAIESSLGITATDGDRIALTYDRNDHPQFVLAGTTLNGCNNTNAYVNSAKDESAFYQVLLTDGVGAPVYTTLINESTTGFNNNDYDFQLLVGANGEAVSDLYFYIELD